VEVAGLDNGKYQITIFGFVPADIASARPGGIDEVGVDLPAGSLDSITCPGRCPKFSKYEGAQGSSETLHAYVHVPAGNFSAVFLYHAPSGFGWVVDGLTVTAQLPTVSEHIGDPNAPPNYTNSAVTGDAEIQYSFPAANTYNWNTGPEPFDTGSSSADWVMPMSIVSGLLMNEAAAASGTNPGAEEWQNVKTLLAGIAFGTAGGFVVAATQEAVAETRTRRSRAGQNRAEPD
jgi:hypothetical protein